MLNTYKGLHILLCAALSVAYNANYKQGINIHAKAYKVIAMQNKA
ncbi:MAG: hypothetical protein SPJ16_04470 [Helicobacter sp.]|nr:hypothetical protein [Helicobacter sp.]MDY5950432.1 hypothetical protein [Helicobacter sp.]